MCAANSARKEFPAYTVVAHAQIPPEVDPGNIITEHL